MEDHHVVKGPPGDVNTAETADNQRLTSAQLARIAYEHEQPFQIGTLLEFGTKVVPWVDGVHDDGNVVMQVWDKEWGGGDHDSEGWEPRAIAQMLQERWPRKTAFTLHDIEQLVDDPSSPADKIAIRPDLSRDDFINLVTSELSVERAASNPAAAPQFLSGTTHDRFDCGTTDSGPALEI